MVYFADFVAFTPRVCLLWWFSASSQAVFDNNVDTLSEDVFASFKYIFFL